MAYKAIIPARSGSKRINDKNIRLLGGKPLLCWTIDACNAVEEIDEIIISTDSLSYFEMAKQHDLRGIMRLDKRTESEAADSVKIFDYLKDKHDKIFSDLNDRFILMLPTVPFRGPNDVREAISLHERTNKPVFSCKEYDFPVQFAFTISDGSWEPLSSASPMLTGNTRSQDQAKYYHPNGGIYVRRVIDLSDGNLSSLYQGAVPMVMEKLTSVDIDTESDFEVANVLATKIAADGTD